MRRGDRTEEAETDEAARIVLGLTQDLADTLARILLAGRMEPDAPRRIEPVVAATAEAVERVLAAPTGSIRLAAAGAIETWFDEPEGATV